MARHQEFEDVIGSFNQLDPTARSERQDSYNEARNKDHALLHEMNTDPKLVALVRARSKGSIQRTPAMPVKCGAKETGEHVALKVIDGEIHIVLLNGKFSTRGSHGNSPSGDRVLTKEFGEAPVVFYCCDHKMRETKFSLALLMKMAIRELARADKKRPAIQLHN